VLKRGLEELDADSSAGEALNESTEIVKVPGKPVHAVHHPVECYDLGRVKVKSS